MKFDLKSTYTNINWVYNNVRMFIYIYKCVIMLMYQWISWNGFYNKYENKLLELGTFNTQSIQSTDTAIQKKSTS